MLRTTQIVYRTMKKLYKFILFVCTLIGAIVGILTLCDRCSSPSQKEIVLDLADELYNKNQVEVKDSFNNIVEIQILKKFQSKSKLFANEYMDFLKNHKPLSKSPMLVATVQRDQNDIVRINQLFEDNVKGLKDVVENVMHSSSKWNNKIDSVSLTEIDKVIKVKNALYKEHFNEILSLLKNGDVQKGIYSYDEMIENEEILKCDEKIFLWNIRMFDLANNRIAEIMNR